MLNPLGVAGRDAEWALLWSIITTDPESDQIWSSRKLFSAYAVR